jgi:hypothetical protein
LRSSPSKASCQLIVAGLGFAGGRPLTRSEFVQVQRGHVSDYVEYIEHENVSPTLEILLLTVPIIANPLRLPKLVVLPCAAEGMRRHQSGARPVGAPQLYVARR